MCSMKRIVYVLVYLLCLTWLIRRLFRDLRLITLHQSASLHDVAEETGSGYGVEIAQLQKASDLLAHAFKLSHRCVSTN